MALLFYFEKGAKKRANLLGLVYMFFKLTLVVKALSGLLPGRTVGRDHPNS
jgi:hypothetical protein